LSMATGPSLHYDRTIFTISCMEFSGLCEKYSKL